MNRIVTYKRNGKNCICDYSNSKDTDSKIRELMHKSDERIQLSQWVKEVFYCKEIKTYKIVEHNEKEIVLKKTGKAKIKAGKRKVIYG